MKRVYILPFMLINGCSAWGTLYMDNNGDIRGYLSFPVSPIIYDNFEKSGISGGIGGSFTRFANDSQYEGYAIINRYKKFRYTRVGMGFSGYIRISKNKMIYFVRDFFNYRVDTVIAIFPYLSFNTYMDINYKYVRFIPFSVGVSIAPYPDILEKEIRLLGYTLDDCPAFLTNCFLVRLNADLLGISIRPIPYLSISVSARTIFASYIGYEAWKEDEALFFPLTTFNINLGDFTSFISIWYSGGEYADDLLFIDAGITYRFRRWTRRKIRVEQIK